MAQRFRTAIIVVTHDEKIIPTFERIYHIRDGRTYEEPGLAAAGKSGSGAHSLPRRTRQEDPTT
jgi:ABC-type siderophore export system fused ATPase/permease subunit